MSYINVILLVKFYIPMVRFCKPTETIASLFASLILLKLLSTEAPVGFYFNGQGGTLADLTCLGQKF